MEDKAAWRKAHLSVLKSAGDGGKLMRTAGELAEILGAKLSGNATAKISGVASPSRAKAEDLIYIDGARYVKEAAKSLAVCVVVKEGSPIERKTNLEVKDPKLAFAKAAAVLMQQSKRAGNVHPSALIAANAKIGKDVCIGPFAVIEEEAEIGEGTTIEAHCVVGASAKIGAGCNLHSRVTVYAGVRIGDRCEVHAGAVLGAPGFGYVFGEGKYWKFPQVGQLEIGDDVEIGANTAVDRGSLEITRLGADVKVDNLVQIAHNVQVGEHTVIASQTGVSGSSIIGSGVLVGGQVGIADHCEIEDGATLGAQAGIPTGKKIHRGQTVWGTPARPLDKFKEQYAWFGKLPELAERLRKLERRNEGE